jgi:hypothetical protein
MRALLWLGALPAVGAVLVYAVDAASEDLRGDRFWETALVVSGVVGLLVTVLTNQGGHPLREALVRGFAAAAMTFALVWVPIIVWLSNCDQCLQ